MSAFRVLWIQTKGKKKKKKSNISTKKNIQTDHLENVKMTISTKKSNQHTYGNHFNAT